MINLIKTIVKSNRLLIILAEKISTSLKINFEKEYKIASYINKPTIVDVGAHKGESILGFKKFSPLSKIYSFEPNPIIYKSLSNTFKFDKLIKIYDYAISFKKINHLYIPEIFGFKLFLWSTFSRAYLRQRWEQFTNINYKKVKLIKINIKSIKLDFYGFKPDIIKIDAEGGELEVIKSARKTIKKNLPLLIIEFHHNNFKEIKKFLKKEGYYPYIFIDKENRFEKISKESLSYIKRKTTSTNIIFYSIKSKVFKNKKIYFKN